MKMEWTYVWAVVITGLVVVFLALVLLILFVTLFGKIFSGTSQKQIKQNTHVQAQQPKPAAEVKPAPTAQSNDNNELVAAISAAVAMMGADEGKNYKVKSVKGVRNKKNIGVSAWGSAGQRENTRPF